MRSTLETCLIAEISVMQSHLGIANELTATFVAMVKVESILIDNLFYSHIKIAVDICCHVKSFSGLPMITH